MKNRNHKVAIQNRLCNIFSLKILLDEDLCDFF